MAKNNDRGTHFEEDIELKIQGIFHESKFEVGRSKGSGNQRHDGDVWVKSKSGNYRNLLYTDCKNFESQTVPNLSQIDKAKSQAERLGFKISALVMNNKKREVIVSMKWDSFEMLLEALSFQQASAECKDKPKTLEMILNKI